MPSFTSQNAAILDYMRKNAFISSWKAIEILKISNLPKRLVEIQRLGHKIEKSWATGINSYGNAVRVRRYSLKDRR